MIRYIVSIDLGGQTDFSAAVTLLVDPKHSPPMVIIETTKFA